MEHSLAQVLGSEGSLQPRAADTPVLREDFREEVALAAANAVLTQPKPADLALAREKAECLRLWEKLRREGLPRKLAADRIASVYADRFPLLQTAGKHGRSALTVHNLDNWKKAAAKAEKQSSTAALVRDYARGRRKRRGDPLFWKMFGAHYMTRKKLSFAEAYRLACIDARKEGIGDMPSESQVRRWYAANMDRAAIDLARLGEDHFGQHYQYFIDRDWESVLVNDMWFSDHHEMDIACRVWNEERQAWRSARVYLTAMMDARSLYIVGWQISLVSGNNETIQNSLALGSITAGLVLPKYLYCDNGADYLAKGFGEPVTAGDYEHSVLRALGIDMVRALPYRAQAKTIERRFLEVCEWFSRRWDGYLGNRPGARSEQGQYFWDNPELQPTLHEVCTEFARWLDQVYHERPSDGKILQGKCPREVWQARQNIREPWDTDALREAFLMPRGVRTVQRGPGISFDNRVYYAQELWSYMGRPGDEGRVLVKIDRYDPEHVYCCRLDGRPICEARTKTRIQALAQSDAEREKIAAAERLKRHQIRAAYTVLERETGGTYRLTSPEDRIRMIMDPEAYRIETVGTRSSVKGGSHNFTHRRLVPAADGSTPESLPEPAAPRALSGPAAKPIEFRTTKQDREDAELRALSRRIDDMLLEPEESPEEPDTLLDDDILDNLYTQNPEDTDDDEEICFD